MSFKKKPACVNELTFSMSDLCGYSSQHSNTDYSAVMTLGEKKVPELVTNYGFFQEIWLTENICLIILLLLFLLSAHVERFSGSCMQDLLTNNPSPSEILKVHQCKQFGSTVTGTLRTGATYVHLCINGNKEIF